MKMEKVKIFKSISTVFFGLFLLVTASCSMANDTLSTVSINLGGRGRAINEADKAVAVFDVYFNGRLVGEKVSGVFNSNAMVDTTLLVRVNAFVNGAMIATGQTSERIRSGQNNITVVLKEIVVPSVAKIDDEEYKDFMTAFNAVQAGQTLTLLADVGITQKLTVNKNITLDLNGHTLSGNNSFLLFEISSGKTFTLRDSGSGGKITGGYSGNFGGAFYVMGTFDMYGGTITGNYAGSLGGGVYVLRSSTFNMYDGEISGNTAAQNGGGVYVYGTFNMYGGSITNNTANTYGGGIYIGKDTPASGTVYGSLNKTSGTVSGNKVSSSASGMGRQLYIVQGAVNVTKNGQSLSTTDDPF